MLANTRSTPFRLPGWLVTLVVVLVATLLLWTEHRAHLLGAVPWLLLLACPLIHLLGRHGHHDNRRGAAPDAHDEGGTR